MLILIKITSFNTKASTDNNCTSRLRLVPIEMLRSVLSHGNSVNITGLNRAHGRPKVYQEAGCISLSSCARYRRNQLARHVVTTMTLEIKYILIGRVTSTSDRNEAHRELLKLIVGSSSDKSNDLIGQIARLVDVNEARQVEFSSRNRY